MSYRDWIAKYKLYINEGGIIDATRAAALRFINTIMGNKLHRMPSLYGESIFELEWDVMVVLDACRPDILSNLNNEYHFVPGTVETMYSLGSSSKQWMRGNFKNDYSDLIGKTVYICGNPFSKDLGGDIPIDKTDFAYVREIWKDAWDEEIDTVPPRPITDSSISAWRAELGERMIVHYMQPHVPYRASGGIDRISIDGTEVKYSEIEKLMLNNISKDKIVEQYIDNLRWVLDDVELLLNSIDADPVLISSDHAELFGRWGIYQHPPVPFPSLRRVPIVRTHAENNNQYTPKMPVQHEEDYSVETQLEMLGYK